MTDELPSVGDRYSPAQVEEFRARGYWRDETLARVLDHWVLEQPDAVFITDGYGELSYAELRGQAYRLAASLLSRGVRPRDRVIVQMPNWNEFAIAALALARIGAVLVPAMPIYRAGEVRYLLEHSGAKAAIVQASFKNFNHLGMWRSLRNSAPSLHSLIVVRGEPGPDELDFADLARPDRGADVPGDDVLGSGPTADDPLFIIYTSGTESKPKGCLHTFNTMLFTSRTMKEYHAWTREDVAFGPSPLAHSTGYNTSILIPLLAGASTHVMDDWQPLEALRRIEKYRCTITTTAVVFLKMLLDEYDPAKHDATSMRAWIAAGSPIPPAVVVQSRRQFASCEVLSLYGRSENQVFTLCRVGEDPDRVTSSDGRAPEGVEVAVLDEQDNPVAPGEVGDLAYRGPGHMLAYFRDPGRTKALFTADGFSRSGDLGYMDKDGYVRVSGRLKDIIVRGGWNISAREIEDHLLAHDDVSDVAVVAMPDGRLGERACAYVVPAPGRQPTLDELTRYLRDEREIAVWKLPERLELVDELPTTPTGKIQKFVLRQDVEQRLEREGAEDGAAT